MRTVGGKVHSHNSNCIYSVAESNGDFIEFSLSIAEQRAVGFIPAWSLAFLQATGLFMDTTFAKEKRFKMKRMKRPLLVKNVDESVNIGGAITHQVECNMFFKGHIERVRMDMCNLGKTEVILGMP